MRVSAHGYDRNHGTREIAQGDMHTEAHVNVAPQKIEILMPASMVLNGKYLLRIELQSNEVSRLFYMTHRDKGLRDAVGILAEFKQEEDKETEAAAQREAKNKVKRRKIP
jgi:hypothetical protein